MLMYRLYNDKSENEGQDIEIPQEIIDEVAKDDDQSKQGKFNDPASL